MPFTQPVHQQWARRGASDRLLEIENEHAAILRAFPDMRGLNQKPLKRVRRRRSASALKRMSEG